MLFDNNKNQRGVFAFLILRIGWFCGYVEPRRNAILYRETLLPSMNAKWVWLPTQAGGKGGGAK
jgi:hypothetical protein